MSRHTMKQYDLSPPFEALLRKTDGTPINLTGATVHFVMQDKAGKVKVSGLVDIVAPASGHVSYQWQEGDTDTSGMFKSEFRIRHADGKPETVPSDGYDEIQILKDLAKYIVTVVPAHLTMRFPAPKVVIT